MRSLKSFIPILKKKIYLIAERILTLGGTPLHTFSDYVNLAKVPVGKNITNDIESVQLVVKSLSVLLKIERAILNESDEGTKSMVIDFIAEQ